MGPILSLSARAWPRRQKEIMPKKQKRFSSEAAILKAIDTEEKHRQERLAAADAYEDLMRIMDHGDFPDKKEFNLELDYQRKMANSARRSAQLASTRKIELGKRLAQFRTMLLPMGSEDTSVVL